MSIQTRSRDEVVSLLEGIVTKWGNGLDQDPVTWKEFLGDVGLEPEDVTHEMLEEAEEIVQQHKMDQEEESAVEEQLVRRDPGGPVHNVCEEEVELTESVFLLGSKAVVSGTPHTNTDREALTPESSLVWNTTPQDRSTRDCAVLVWSTVKDPYYSIVWEEERRNVDGGKFFLFSNTTQPPRKISSHRSFAETMEAVSRHAQMGHTNGEALLAEVISLGVMASKPLPEEPVQEEEPRQKRKYTKRQPQQSQPVPSTKEDKEQRQEDIPVIALTTKEARSLLLDLGIENADKISRSDMTNILNRLAVSSDTDTLYPEKKENKKVYSKVMNALHNGSRVEVVWGGKSGSTPPSPAMNGHRSKNGDGNGHADVIQAPKRRGRPPKVRVEGEVSPSIREKEKEKVKKGKESVRRNSIMGEVLYQLQKEGPMSKEDLHKKVCKAYPDKDEDTVRNSITCYLYTGLPRKGYTVKKDAEGNLYIK